MAASYIANLEKYSKITALIGEAHEGLSRREHAIRGISAIALLSREVGLPTDLRALGACEQDLPAMAAAAIGVKRLLGNHPRKLEFGDIENIYTLAYTGTPVFEGAAAAGRERSLA
jgi:alcohol dehydrogenase class IV